MDSEGPFNFLGTRSRLVLLAITVVAVALYALRGGNLLVLPLVGAIGLLYHFLFWRLAFYFERLFRRWR